MINEKEGLVGILKRKLDHKRKQVQEQGRKIQDLEREKRQMKLIIKSNEPIAQIFRELDLSTRLSIIRILQDKGYMEKEK